MAFPTGIYTVPVFDEHGKVIGHDVHVPPPRPLRDIDPGPPLWLAWLPFLFL